MDIKIIIHPFHIWEERRTPNALFSTQIFQARDQVVSQLGNVDILKVQHEILLHSPSVN